MRGAGEASEVTGVTVGCHRAGAVPGDPTASAAARRRPTPIARPAPTARPRSDERRPTPAARPVIPAHLARRATSGNPAPQGNRADPDRAGGPSGPWARSPVLGSPWLRCPRPRPGHPVRPNLPDHWDRSGRPGSRVGSHRRGRPTAYPRRSARSTRSNRSIHPARPNRSIHRIRPVDPVHSARRAVRSVHSVRSVRSVRPCRYHPTMCRTGRMRLSIRTHRTRLVPVVGSPQSPPRRAGAFPAGHDEGRGHRSRRPVRHRDAYLHPNAFLGHVIPAAQPDHRVSDLPRDRSPKRARKHQSAGSSEPLTPWPV